VVKRARYDTSGKTSATQQQQLYHRAVNISLQLNLRDCDRPMIKLLLLGGARFTNFGHIIIII
jgi:hypothetical protein